MIRKTNWKRGIGEGKNWKAEISGRMTTIEKEKTEWDTLEDYEEACLNHYGTDYEVRCYEYQNHYAVVFRLWKNIPARQTGEPHQLGM